MNLEGLTEKRNRKGTVYYENALKKVVLKRCTKCREFKKVKEYHIDKSGVGGTRSKCKKCSAERDRNYHEKNRNKRLERMRQNYKENKGTRLDYYYIHRERTLKRKRERYLLNREAELARMRRWQRENPEKVALNVQRRRARKATLPNDLTEEQYRKTLEFFDNKCALMGVDTDIQIEHAIPVSSGHGGTTFENCYPLAGYLNLSKGDRNIFEWFEANRKRFKLSQERFDRLIEWLGKANDMTVEEYRDYVYWCHDNPVEIDEDVAI